MVTCHVRRTSIISSSMPPLLITCCWVDLRWIGWGRCRRRGTWRWSFLTWRERWLPSSQTRRRPRGVMRTTSKWREGYSWSLRAHCTQRRSPSPRSITLKSPWPKHGSPAQRSPGRVDLSRLAMQGKERLEERSKSLAAPSTKRRRIRLPRFNLSTSGRTNDILLT